jgi:hypothetical protein
MTGAGTIPAAHPSRFRMLLACVALLAFAVRELFVLSTIVDAPIVGDIGEYVSYAWNLVHHGVFSNASPDASVAPPPDSYRLPGYPWLIALGMTWFPAQWMAFVLQVQVLLGTASVVLVALLARQWMSMAWAIFAGLLLALWPHHIAATGTMLSEVTFGFLLVAACYAFARAWTAHHHHVAMFVVAGLAFAAAWLVNPLIMLFPPLLAALALRHGRRRSAAVLLGVFLLPVALMSLRDAGIAGESGSVQRARLNFVQGSWPEYHAAANRFRTGDKTAIAIMQEIQNEDAALAASPSKGLARIGERIAVYPSFYVKWYLAKPWLAWGWQIRIGANDLYFLRVQHSPLDRNAVLRGIVQLYRLANPLLTLLTLACAVVVLVAGLRKARWAPAAATGGLALYITLVHVVLQAEPRYAIAYRGIEAVLVATVLAWCAGLRSTGGVRRFRRTRTA